MGEIQNCDLEREEEEKERERESRNGSMCDGLYIEAFDREEPPKSPKLDTERGLIACLKPIKKFQKVWPTLTRTHFTPKNWFSSRQIKL